MKRHTNDAGHVAIGIFVSLIGLLTMNSNFYVALFFVVGGIAWFWGAVHAEERFRVSRR